MDDKAEGGERAPFDSWVQAMLRTLPPAEQRMARFFVDRKKVVLLGSAAEIAQQAGTSDATVVRTARSLGFGGLSDLREALFAELAGSPSPGKRLKRTLDEAGDDAVGALRHVIGLHEDVLDVLKRYDFAASFAQAVEILTGAGRRQVFGIGPSGALAQYATLQFNRVGLTTTALCATGVALADQLLGLQPRDAILMIAYAPLYREVTIVLEQARRSQVPIVLVSDSLSPYVADDVAVVLPVPRGKANHLAMHGGTMVLIEAIIIGLAGQDRDRALAALDRLSSLRGAIDKDWSKRGIRKSGRYHASGA
jgi:DNA-binding MurR/RpiR family transcriptional regulator